MSDFKNWKSGARAAIIYTESTLCEPMPTAEIFSAVSIGPSTFPDLYLRYTPTLSRSRSLYPTRQELRMILK